MLLAVNNLGSVALIFVLYLLVMQNRHSPEPYRWQITSGYVIWMILVAVVFLARNEFAVLFGSDSLRWLTAIAKLVIASTLGFVVARLDRLHNST